MRSEQEIKAMLTQVAKEEDPDAAVEDELTALQALQDALSWVLYRGRSGMYRVPRGGLSGDAGCDEVG